MCVLANFFLYIFFPPLRKRWLKIKRYCKALKCSKLGASLPSVSTLKTLKIHPCIPSSGTYWASEEDGAISARIIDYHQASAFSISKGNDTVKLFCIGK